MADYPDWQTKELWRKQVERRLYEIGSLVKGGVLIQADRISDVLELIDELRAELKRVSERQDKIAEYLKSQMKETNNG